MGKRSSVATGNFCAFCPVFLAMKKFLRNFADYAVYLLVRVVICVAQCLSLDVCRRGAELLAFLFLFLDGDLANGGGNGRETLKRVV